ncbi:MAG: hypothetical protein WC330_03600 [Candidatus Omnitrophota bacterium]|jgi:hypothetical protein
MPGKIIKIFLLVLVMVFLSLIGFRNHIFKIYLENYAGKSLKAECRIKKVNLWLDSVSLEGVAINAKDFNVIAKNITIKFKAQKEKPYFYLSDVILSDVNFKIEPLENIKTNSSNGKAYPGLPVFNKPVKLSLQNINIALKSKSLEINSSFSIIADVGAGIFFLKDARVVNFYVKSQDFEVTNLNLTGAPRVKPVAPCNTPRGATSRSLLIHGRSPWHSGNGDKFGKNNYLLKIPGIRIKDKKFTDFLIPIKSGANQLLFPRAKNPFLGADALVSAKCDFSGYDKFCLGVKFRDVSFEKVVDIFASEEAAFRGVYDGLLRACMSSFKISEIEADFKNKGNGFINVKKESSFAFLKSYLDEASYNALIDNFKNYEYNIGIISAKKEASALNLNLDFTSDAMGKRNVTISFHDVLGGMQ